MRLVVIESPYAGNIPLNVAYAKAAVLDCLRRGESPYASHLFFTQVLNDAVHLQRWAGMTAGFAWGDKADATVVYEDLGCSSGIIAGIERARLAQRPVEYRKLEDFVDFARFANCRAKIAWLQGAPPCICVFCGWLNTTLPPKMAP